MEIKEKKWCVYIHRNKINNKVYIGIAKGNPRHRCGKNGKKYESDSKPVFYNAIQKYGWNNFEHIIWCENLSQEDARQWEIRLIALFKTNCCRYRNPEFGYNMTDGGEGTSGYKHTEEARDKMSKSHQGKMFSEETKQRISEGHKNPSKETRRKMSEAKKGKSHSEEHNKKISDSHKGIKWNNERKQKISGENSHNYGKGRHVIQLSIQGEYIAEYVSSQEAGRITGIVISHILCCCNHKPHYKTAGGFKWMYRDEYLNIIQN